MFKLELMLYLLYLVDSAMHYHLQLKPLSLIFLQFPCSIRWRDEMTNTSGGIRMMGRMFGQAGNRWDSPDIGIIITDGESNRDAHLVNKVC